jgi:predicted CXXCH cytochrome family protein
MKRLAVVSLLFVAGVFLILFSTTAWAQDDDEKEYVGARECSSCHRGLARSHEETAHALALFEADDDEFIVADFEAGEAERTITLPGEDEAEPFEADDAEFVIGVGRYAQRFVYEVDRGEYVVLPVEWDVTAGEWQPYGPVEEFPNDPAYDFGASCAGCHTTGLNARRVRWEDEGVECEACHGPGSIHVDEAESAGDNPSDRELEDVRGAIVRSPDPQICGQCHVRGTEVEDGYPFPVEYIPGGELIGEETFVLPGVTDETHWWASGHARMPNMQFNEWLNSAHATALSTMLASSAAKDECLQCHSGDYRFTERTLAAHEDGEREGDPPEPVTLDTAQFGVTCTTCHDFHMEDAETDFLLADEAYNICVDCHTSTGVTENLHHPVQHMFEGLTLVEGIEGIPSTHFSEDEGPRCTTCHAMELPVDGSTRASHALQPVLPGIEGQPDACTGCHTDLEPGDMLYIVEDTQAAVSNRLSLARGRLSAVDVSTLEDDTLYNQVLQAIDFVQNDGSNGVHNYLYADALLDFAEHNLSQLSVTGAVFEPTEAPAPTSIPAEPLFATGEPEEVEDTGFRPITYATLLLSVIVLAGIGFFIYRRPIRDE